MTRIRYVLQPDGSFQSGAILTQDGMVLVRLKDDQYEIIQVDTGIVLDKGEKVGSARLKKTVKNLLVLRGAVFSDEVRRREKVGSAEVEK